jgi:hypothetical protein
MKGKFGFSPEKIAKGDIVTLNAEIELPVGLNLTDLSGLDLSEWETLSIVCSWTAAATAGEQRRSDRQKRERKASKGGPSDRRDASTRAEPHHQDRSELSSQNLVAKGFDTAYQSASSALTRLWRSCRRQAQTASSTVCGRASAGQMTKQRAGSLSSRASGRRRCAGLGQDRCRGCSVLLRMPFTPAAYFEKLGYAVLQRRTSRQGGQAYRIRTHVEVRQIEDGLITH